MEIQSEIILLGHFGECTVLNYLNLEKVVVLRSWIKQDMKPAC